MKKLQRLTAILWILCLLLGLMPATATATEGQSASASVAAETVPAETDTAFPTEESSAETETAFPTEVTPAGTETEVTPAGTETAQTPALTVPVPEIPARLGAYVVTDRADYTVAPGISETELTVNAEGGLDQNRIRILELDPSDPGISLAAGYKDYDGSSWGMQLPSRQAEAAEAALREANPNARVVGVLNANFYNMVTGEPIGAFVMNGQILENTRADFAYLAVLQDGSVEIRPGSVPIGEDVAQAVAGRELLVHQGVPLESSDENRYPRSAVGLKADGTLVLWLCEGRLKPLSEGLTLEALARMLADLGCVEAVNLDGGGSAQMLTARGEEALTMRGQPSDGYERHISSTLLVVSDSAEPVTQPVRHDHVWTVSEDETAAVCACGETVALSEFTGLITDAEGKRFCCILGQRKSGWITWGTQMLHSNADGVLHEVRTDDTRTCVANGKISAVCQTCKKTYTGNALWRIGHSWDENHVCTRCGAEGIDISRCTVTMGKTFVYRTEGQSVMPTPTLRDGNYTLVIKNSTLGDDGYLSWENYDRVGPGKVIVEGQGNYYGRIEQTYSIVPDTVSVTCEKQSADSVTLSWSPVPGADSYLISAYDAATRKPVPKLVTDSEARSALLLGLEPETDYYFCVRGRAVTDGTEYLSASYTWCKITTPAASDAENGTNAALTAVRVPLSERDVLTDQTDREGIRCIFLPAFADLTALPTDFVLSGADEEETLTVAGSRARRTAERSDVLNLDALCWPEPDGARLLQITLGERTPVTLRVYQAACPALFLRSQDPESRGREWVDASKSNVATGTAALIRPDGTRVYDGDLTQLKARGNTTFRYSPKKAYQIKIKKTDLIGIGEKVKTWVLLAGYSDATQLHDKLLKDLAADLGMAYTPRNDWVDLYYDGEYRGLYLLGEKNSVGSSGVDITDLESCYEAENPEYGKDPVYKKGVNRFGAQIRWTEGLTDPADITGGYLLELNHNFLDEVNGFITTRNRGFNVKSPEFLSKDALCYISEYVQEFEDAVYNPDHSGRNPDTGKYYYEYVDRDSLVRFYLVQELANNVDGFISSTYFYKDAGGIMYAGPVWDLDSTLGGGWSGRVPAELNFISTENSVRYLAKELIQIPDFARAVRSYYRETFRSEAERMLGEDGRIAVYSARITPSAWMNYRLWPYVAFGNPQVTGHIWEGVDYSEVIDQLQTWVAARLQALDERFPEEPPFRFDDVKDESRYYFTPVYWAVEQGITKGTSETCFSPDKTCTRAEAVTFLWRAAGCPEPKFTDQPFQDISYGAYYVKAVRWAVEQGITRGTSDAAFSPNKECTRAQVVTFLWRAAGCPAPNTAENPFTDVAAGAYYEQAALWAVEQGITKGTTDTAFSPNDPCIRAMVVTFLWRTYHTESH